MRYEYSRQKYEFVIKLKLNRNSHIFGFFPLIYYKYDLNQSLKLNDLKKYFIVL